MPCVFELFVDAPEGGFVSRFRNVESSVVDTIIPMVENMPLSCGFIELCDGWQMLTPYTTPIRRIILKTYFYL